MKLDLTAITLKKGSAVRTIEEIKRNGAKGIQICWSDSESQEISSKILRENCPCATCKESRGDTSHAKPLGGKSNSLRIIESTIDEELHLKKIWPVGNYAIGLEWADGHNTGIYTLEHLESLAIEKSSSVLD